MPKYVPFNRKLEICAGWFCIDPSAVYLLIRTFSFFIEAWTSLQQLVFHIFMLLKHYLKIEIKRYCSHSQVVGHLVCLKCNKLEKDWRERKYVTEKIILTSAISPNSANIDSENYNTILSQQH